MKQVRNKAERAKPCERTHPTKPMSAKHQYGAKRLFTGQKTHITLQKTAKKICTITKFKYICKILKIILIIREPHKLKL